MSTDDTPPEVVEVPVKKIELNLTLNDFLGALTEKTRSVSLSASTPSVAAPVIQPEIAQHLQRISELAAQLQDEINQINQIDPEALTRLKQAEG